MSDAWASDARYEANLTRLLAHKAMCCHVAHLRNDHGHSWRKIAASVGTKVAEVRRLYDQWDGWTDGASEAR